MSFRYHALGGINDETLRQVYLNSLPTELQGELQRIIELSGRGLRDITLGEIHMFTHTALDELCATQRVWAKMIKEGRKYDRYCKLPPTYHLKCNSTEHCNCRANRQVAEEILSDADIESFFSEQEDVNQLTSFMVQDSDDSSTSSEQTGYTDPDSPSEVYQATSNGSSGTQVKIQILKIKYSKPVPVIAYFDTGAHSSMMNPNVLPQKPGKKRKMSF
ncbi:hypothetical protein Ddye_013532 [Dipteronia dyeriana]|uniref:Uncharacterized protein n=1 Tax=Dipteronia dyeriana TaxID=168575 RepID=A0AAD9X6K3_9ROSI|nr:hypothetical protein Ddye_013532 [Dipteronia dyeriana]